MSERRIEVFADVGCPFAHVGLLRLVAARAEAGRDDVDVVVRSWPLELVNGTPLDGGFIGEEIEELRRVAAPDLFAGFSAEAFPASTLPSMRLTAAAYRGDASVGEAVALEVRRRLFERGEDVGDPDVLADVAAAHGLDLDAATAVNETDHDAVHRDWTEGQARGVVGSPHFFLTGTDYFCPALHVRHDDGRLVVDADPERFRDFLHACFA